MKTNYTHWWRASKEWALEEWPQAMKEDTEDFDQGQHKNLMQEGKGTTEDETVGWHHRLDGYEFEQAPGVGDGQGSQAGKGSYSEPGGEGKPEGKLRSVYGAAKSWKQLSN